MSRSVMIDMRGEDEKQEKQQTHACMRANTGLGDGERISPRTPVTTNQSRREENEHLDERP
jgi:hypothetical protein